MRGCGQQHPQKKPRYLLLLGKGQREGEVLLCLGQRVLGWWGPSCPDPG